MSALLIVRHEDPLAAEGVSQAGRESLAAQGFPAPKRRAFPGGSLYWHATPQNPSSEELLQDVGEAGDCVACVGTLFYRGRAGGQALRELWRDFTAPEAFGWDTLWGNYLLAVVKNGKAWVFGDPVGMVKLYHTGNRAVWSTSWLACAAAAGSREIDRIGVIDYVMSGANHGDRTPIAAVRIADPAQAVELATLATRPLTTPAQWTEGPRYATMAQAVDAAAAILTDRAAALAAGFGERIRSALSGGFDSRLIVASLRAAGVNPKLHVYGRPGDEDVRIAQRAAQAIGLPLEHIDKSALNRTLPEPTDELFHRQSLFFDGLPTDGIFDRGADRLTRIRQSADGWLALNGGGGEILRNFFYLHDRPFTAAEIVRVFYSNWAPAAIPSAADRRDYRDYMADAIERSVGAGGRLSRTQVELIYPLFRVRYWTSRNNGLAVRCGHFLTPLVDPELVRLSQALPLGWKDYGRFESALLARLDPALGAVPLSYGFTPADGPTASYRAKMWLQHRRPPWLRGRSAMLRRVFPALGRHRSPSDVTRPDIDRDPLAAVLRASEFTDQAMQDRARTFGAWFAAGAPVTRSIA